ncbi:unnamed protein product [Spirodela intermedia]|uniref:HMA domain-containing protein n=1 Tax=Spirodela intermedia TaxID=51605 RepID=A0A7I8JBC5_SPIIN|nr:unnamed protein product [Spirodela intermedia]CAA6666772.1 unnamed protein product [Spirodela intermedia]
MENLQIIPIPKDVQPQYVEMKVPLYSHGCERKVKTSLSHLKGIYSVQVHCDDQKVTVWGICSKEAVLAAVKKKRRGAHFWDQEEDDAGKEGGAPGRRRRQGKRTPPTSTYLAPRPGEKRPPMGFPDPKDLEAAVPLAAVVEPPLAPSHYTPMHEISI